MTNINDILLEGARRLMPHAIDEHRSVVEAAITIAAMIAHADPSVLVRDDGTASLVVDIGGAEVIVVTVSVSDGTVWSAYVGDVRISWSQSDRSSWPQHAVAAGLSVDKCRWTVKTLSKSTPWLPEEFAAALSKSLDPASVDRAELEPLILPSPQRLLAECMSNSLSSGRFGDFEKAVAYAERLVKLAEDGFFEVAQVDVYRLHRGGPRLTPPRDDGGKGGAA